MTAFRKKLIRQALLVALAASGNFRVSAAGTGDEVIIIYNSRMPESKSLAEYYAERRNVPREQIFGFALPTGEDISRSEFRDSLQKPLAQKLEQTGLWHVATRNVLATTNHPARTEERVVQSKIRFAALCYGVPLRISDDPNLKEEGLQKVRPEMRKNGAAVDSELALLPVLQLKLPLHGPAANWTYGTTNSALLHPTNGVLLVTRLDGPTPTVARSLVDKALQAERDGLWGRAYFDLRNISDPGMKTGDDWIRGAAEICRRLGFETIVDEHPGTFPAGFPIWQVGFYAGWYNQDVDGPFALPIVEFLPGAFAYHLHSFSAMTLRSTTRGWAGPLLAKGATATMGCVDEPYLAGTPDMSTFFGRFVFHGFSFGEAAYACQPVLSWQTTVVGDPLYRPFGRTPEELRQDLASRNSGLEDWYYIRLVNLNLALGKTAAEAISVLEGMEQTKESALLTEKLGDLYAAQGKPSSAVHAYQQALKLKPSPQQRLQLLLTLGNKLTALDRNQEAYENYQTVLRERPDYPDQSAILKKILPLARKLDKPSDAAQYEAQLKNLSAVTR